MKLSNKLYNFLKWVTTIFLPAAGALYYGMTEVWEVQRTAPVNATINVIIAFLGTVLGLSTRSYNKQVKESREAEDSVIDGDLIVTEVDGEKYLGLGVNGSIEQMQAKDVVRLNVIDKSLYHQDSERPDHRS